jgi:uncharacterized protein (TIGR00730 family)
MNDIPNTLKSICVFCGSGRGASEKYSEAAWKMGKLLAREEITLIFGGGQVGLMGVVADSVMKHGGKVIGVIPTFLSKKEIAHEGITEMIVVESMHQRKQRMADLSDGFIAMPGGMGTLEELSEVLTWSQLGLHKKPIGLLNAADYYKSLIKFIDHMVDEKFTIQQNRDSILIEEDAESLLALMRNYKAPDKPQWLDRAHT